MKLLSVWIAVGALLVAQSPQAPPSKPPAEPVHIALRLRAPAVAGMPVWLYADGLGGDLTVRYPYYDYPEMIGSNQLELQRGGVPVAPRAPRGLRMYEGPAGRVLGSVAPPTAPQGRLPLHVLYELTPGHYRVRWSVVALDFRAAPPAAGTKPTEPTLAESDWFDFDVAPPNPAQRGAWLTGILSAPPTDPGLIVGDYLPSLFAALDDPRAQRAVLDQTYSGNTLVAAIAASLREYLPAAVQIELTLAGLRERGPTPDLGREMSVDANLYEDHAGEIVTSALPYLSRPNDAQVEGALDVLRFARFFPRPPSAAVIAKVDRAVEAVAPGIIARNGAAAHELALYLAADPDGSADELLLSILAQAPAAAEQAAIVLANRGDASDLPALQAWLLAPSPDRSAESGRASVVDSVARGYGGAALPVLRRLLRESAAVPVRSAAAEELFPHGDAAAIQYCLDVAHDASNPRQANTWSGMKLWMIDRGWLPPQSSDKAAISFLRQAVENPPVPPAPPTVDPVEARILRLRSADPVERRAAAAGLVALPNPAQYANFGAWLMNDIIRPFPLGPDAPALDSPAWWDGILLMGRLRLPALTEMVVYLPNDAVVAALVELGMPAIPSLREVLAIGGPPRRRAAANALGQIGGDDARGALQAALKTEPDTATRQALRAALDHLGKRQPPLPFQ